MKNTPHFEDPITLNGHSNTVRSVAFSPSSHLLASGSDDSTTRLWSAKTGAEIAVLSSSRSVNSVAFSPAGTMLASGMGSGEIILWDVGSRAEIATLKGHSHMIWSITFSPDGTRLISGSADKTARLWDVKSRASIRTLKDHSDSVMCVAFSPDGKTIASGSHDNTIRLWSVVSGTTTAVLGGHSGYVTSVAFSPNGTQLASASNDNTIKLWDAATGVLKATINDHSGHVRSVSFSPDGRHLASGSFDETIRLWNIPAATYLFTLEGVSGRVYCVSFSPDGSHLASGSGDNTARIWKLSQEQHALTSNLAELTLTTTDGHQDTIASVSVEVPPNNDITGSVSLEGITPIGYGGFGELFLGIHTDRGKVALKKPRRLVDEALARRFLREIDLWCSVSHPHILPCLGMCKIGLNAYVVSPFIENGDLLSCMIRGKALNRSKLLFEVAEALTHLHHRGIVHGDVKAQNILVADDGSALLCDFGLAKAFDTMATSTEAKGAGSVRWMAPELFRDASRSMASDVYSLGITIAEVLSGRAPYPTISESLAVMLHVAYDDGRPAKEPLRSPEGKSYATLWRTAEKCWVKDTKARPHMAEVLGMLFPLTREMT